MISNLITIVYLISGVLLFLLGINDAAADVVTHLLPQSGV